MDGEPRFSLLVWDSLMRQMKLLDIDYDNGVLSNEYLFYELTDGEGGSDDAFSCDVADLDGGGNDMAIAFNETLGKLFAVGLSGEAITATEICADQTAAGSLFLSVGDMDCDGKDDILFADKEGRLTACLMDGVATRRATAISGAPKIGAKLVFVDLQDIDFDGCADIILRKVDSSGKVVKDPYSFCRVLPVAVRGDDGKKPILRCAGKIPLKLGKEYDSTWDWGQVTYNNSSEGFLI